MDKEEFRVKLEEINNLVESKDYQGALKVVDSIDWRRVKNVRTLCIVGEIYAANKRYEDSREIFLLAYHRAPIGKNILNRLIEISLKMGDVEEAQEYYEEYVNVAPDDNTHLILKYKLQTERKDPIEDRIHTLEEYKEREFVEKWSYELAKLYYQYNDKDKCLDLCDEMILWFNDGPYVTKAMELKQRMGKLTGGQLERLKDQEAEEVALVQEAQEAKEKKAQFLESVLATQEQNQQEEPVSAVQEETSVSSKVAQLKNALKIQVEKKAQDIDSLEEDDDNDVADEQEGSYIESIQIKNEKDYAGVESLQEKITKGFRDIFGARREEASDAEDEDDVISVSDDHIKQLDEPMSQEEEVDDVKVAPAVHSSRRHQVQEAEQAENIPEEETAGVEASSAEGVAEVETGQSDVPAEKEKTFNLEDTILAAATAQGIEIPKEEALKEEALKEASQQAAQVGSGSTFDRISNAVKQQGTYVKRVQVEENAAEVDLDDTRDLSRQLEEEEFLTEEDMAEAEKEFFHGPAKKNVLDDKRIDEMLKEQMNEDDGFDDSSEEPGAVEADASDFEQHVDAADASPVKKPKKKAGLWKRLEITEAGEEDEEEEDVLEPAEVEPAEEEPEEEEIDLTPEKTYYEPRSKNLTEEEVRLFSYFVKIPGMKEQLLDALRDVQEGAEDHTSRRGNIIVMGGRETGKTKLISLLIPAICNELNLEATKVAYVFADQINGRDMTKITQKLAGGFFVIEGANQLDQKTADALNKAMEADTNGLIVILEDEKIGMRKMIARYQKFARKFTSMINIPVFTNDELVNFAKVYTQENGYRIDQMGMLALYNQIGESQKEDEPMNIGAVKQILDNAFARAEGGILKLNRKKRMDKDGYIILHEKDFS